MSCDKVCWIGDCSHYRKISPVSRFNGASSTHAAYFHTMFRQAIVKGRDQAEMCGKLSVSNSREERRGDENDVIGGKI